MLLLAGFAALTPQPMAWIYVAAVAVFETWLARRIALAGRLPVPVGEPPYHFNDDEARLVGRYRFYFTYPAIARQASSALAAAGLTTLVLVPWMLIKGRIPEAALIGMNVFVVARFTKALTPQLALRIRAHKGDREALRMLELHDPLWKKINDANAAGPR